MKKLSNTEADLKKSVAIKKACISAWSLYNLVKTKKKTGTFNYLATILIWRKSELSDKNKIIHSIAHGKLTENEYIHSISL